MSRKNLSLLLLAVSFFLVFAGCSGFSGKPAMKDGMILKYNHKMKTPVGDSNFTTEYKFTRESNGKYKVKLTPSGMELRGKKLPPVPPMEATVNDQMKTDKGDLLLVHLVESPIWMPPKLRKEGAKFYEYKMTGTKKWDKRECCVYEVKSALGEVKAYYDKNTGYFVGCDVKPVNGRIEMKLIESNVDGL